LEKPETIHLYVVREEEIHPSLFPIILSVFALLVLVVVGVASPYTPPEVRKTLRLPAVFLPLQTFTAEVKIIPTGVKTYPATFAHGILTITNGSIISLTIPQGFTLDGVVTDTSVFVPAGSANGYGYATVQAHAMQSGKIGNIPAYTINAVEGSSVYIRNLSAFTGGRDSYSVKIETPHDKQTAITTARAFLKAQVSRRQAMLASPCHESSKRKNSRLRLFWTCQYVTYAVPSYMSVTHVRLVGKTLLVDVKFVEHVFALVK